MSIQEPDAARQQLRRAELELRWVIVAGQLEPLIQQRTDAGIEQPSELEEQLLAEADRIEFELGELQRVNNAT